MVTNGMKSTLGHPPEIYTLSLHDALPICLEKLELEDKNMVKKIMRDPLFLAQKSTDATEADQQEITDLLDTLRANLDHCVGMAANMIGVKKNIIVVAAGPFQFAMVNPVITKKTGAFIIKVSTTGMLVPLKADLRFPISGQ